MNNQSEAEKIASIIIKNLSFEIGRQPTSSNPLTILKPILIEALQKQIDRAESAEHDIDAYRGELGYPVRGDHSGMLKNGQFPFNGIADAKEKEISRLQAELAKAKAENERLKNPTLTMTEVVLREKEKSEIERKIKIVEDYPKLKTHADKLAEALNEISNIFKITKEMRVGMNPVLAYKAILLDCISKAKQALKTHAEFKDRKEKE